MDKNTNKSVTKISDFNSNDVLIALMGITGSGKSTFISLLSEDFVQIGHELSSCTADVEVHKFIYKNTRCVYLIDTPGFDDTNRTDTDVLKQLAFWLGDTYKTTVQLSGVIYLHRITDDRMSGSSLRNLMMFKKLCGEDAMKHVSLVTNFWSNLNTPTLTYETGVAREKELVTRKDWWGLMQERGSTVVRHDGTKECALAIVERLIERRAQEGPVILDIQKEMIDDKKSLEDTAAGQEVEKELSLAKKKFEQQISDLQESYDEALKERDVQLAEVLQEQRDDLEQRLQRAGEAQENLKITFEKLYEEKMAEFAAQHIELNNELVRVQAELQKKDDENRKDLENVERQRKEAEERTQELLKAQKTTEAERAKEEKENLDRIHQKMEERFAFERQQQQQHMQAVQAQMMQLQQAHTNSGKEKSSMMPLISLFAGMATSGIGLLTLNPTAVLSGIGTALDGLSGGGGQ